MKLLKMKLLVIALCVFIAGPVFASVGYDVSIDTASLSATSGYLYFQYVPAMNAGTSAATVAHFTTDGALASAPSGAVDGSAVTGMLTGAPYAVVFANTNGINDYNHGITFGNALNFALTFTTPPGGQAGGSSTFSLGFFADADGNTPLLSSNGTLFTVSLMNNGMATYQTLASQAKLTPTPIPGALWLLGSGLMGLVGVRRLKKD